jgi:putative ABC transport system permease protein
MNRAYRKNVARTITRSLGRYLAIFAIIALGVGFFAGIRQTKPAMIVTLDNYVKEYRLFDFRILSTIGFTAEEVERVREMADVETAAGAISQDFIFRDEEGNTGVLRAHSLAGGVNVPDLKAGRMPEAADEILLDASAFPESAIGTVIRVAEENGDETKDALAHKAYTVTGLARSVAYMNTERGTTTLGNGKLTGFAYLPEAGFSSEYYGELLLVMEHDHEVYSDAYGQAVDAWSETLETAVAALVNERYESEMEKARAEIDDARRELAEETGRAEAELADAKAKLDDALKEIERGERQLADAREEIRKKADELAGTERELRLQLEQAAGLGDPALTAPLEAALAQVAAGRAELEAGKAELAARERELGDARRDWADGLAEYEKGVRQLAEEREKAETEIHKAEEELASFKAPDVYVLTRDTNTGYVSFENDAGTVEGIGKVFPLFFLLIAALVCSTTMTRMVDDERTQIGTLRALGYGNGAIMGKYAIYAGSAALLGCVVGYVVGIRVFPATIWQAYSIMYGFADITVVGDPVLFVLSIVVSLLCSVGTAWAACRNELRRMPAELIRPKSPPAGKRILLERIGFLWRRLKFLHKVSARNIFRFKKRLFMMIVGIAGCMALVVTGYGLRDSITNIAEFQFDEIMHHDVSVTFREPLTEELAAEALADAGGILDRAVIQETSVDALREDGGIGKTVYLIATDDPAIGRFADLHRDGKQVAFPGAGETVLSEKLAEIIGAEIGGEVTFRYADEKRVTLTVSGIFENYVMHYAYVTADTFEQAFGEPYEPKTLYLMLEEGTDAHALAAAVMEHEDAASVNVVADFRNTVEQMMGRMNDVVLLVIASAGALAFIVLFNLTNINITERAREIATLKVLGFYRNETRSYVFRENLVLSLMGIVVGLPLGVLLHRFVMDQINIDIVSFEVTILPQSYLYSVLTVLAFTLVVNLLMDGKIERISMAESLKSME